MRLSIYAIFFLALFSPSISYSGTDSADLEGAEYFSLEALLPDEASFINAEARYMALAPSECQHEKDSGSSFGMTVQGAKTVTLIDEQSSGSKSINQRIPLSYHRGNCHMWLYNVVLVFSAIYGPGELQDATAGLIIDIFKRRPEGAPVFNKSGVLAFNSTCSWLFRVDGRNISKLLFCSPTEKDNRTPQSLYSWKAWQGALHVAAGINELPGKNIKLGFQISNEEQPTFEDAWIRTSKGWQLCETEEATPYCKIPISVSKFKMNGQECTVYPNCKE